MKHIFWGLAFLLLTACQANPLEVEIHNPSAAARNYETIEIDWEKIRNKVKEITPEEVVVLDGSKKQVPSQVIFAGTDTPQQLIFQVSLPGAGSALYTIEKGIREEYPVQAYSRFVPERLDDYAWENNLGAYRVYGPALADPQTPGIDVWVKSTPRMIIDDWYAGKDYHTNKGEGMDAYKVGPTLGGGGSAPYFDGKLWLSGNFTTQQRLDNGPLRTSVKLTYAPFTVGDISVSLEKIISLDANSYFSKMTNTYTGSFESMPVAAGIVLHDVKDIFTDRNYIGVYEALSDTKQPEVDGDVALGIILPEAYAVTESEDHLLIIRNATSGEPLVYWSGTGWSQAGVEDAAKWQAILLQKKDQIEEPMVVFLK